MNTGTERHILIVEDEVKIASAMRDYLQSVGHRVTVIERGDEAADWVRVQAPSVVLLDVMLPGMDGMDVCRALRVFSTVPIIMVTARIEEIDRLLGLELGADDYLCKPFSLRELAARVKALIRRSSALHDDAVSASPVVLDADRHEVRVGELSVAVTPVEFRLLRRMLEPPGRVWSRQQLMEASYDDHRIVSDRTVDSHIRNLRRKFAPFQCDPFVSVYGVGFRFDWP